MKACGVIVEYNPFHYGHVYHLEQARLQSQADVIVAVMSPNFVQRGEPALINKWQRTHAALLHGVDLVLELPTLYATQSAQIFAHHAVEILNRAEVSTLVFGSETNDLEQLNEIAELPIRLDYFKELMDQGYGYPKALSLASTEAGPNDILAMAYLKALQSTNIQPISIQRTNSYHGLEIEDSISSASAIRHAITHELPYQTATPMNLSASSFVSWNDYYPYLRFVLLSQDRSQLATSFLMDEGIEAHLQANADQYDTFASFIQASTSRRYSTSRIQRICLHLLLNHRRQDIQAIYPSSTFRVLGFNAAGQTYLRQLKDHGVNYASSFKQLPKIHRNLEFQATQVYALALSETKRKELLKQELQNLIVIR